MPKCHGRTGLSELLRRMRNASRRKANPRVQIDCPQLRTNCLLTLFVTLTDTFAIVVGELPLAVGRES